MAKTDIENAYKQVPIHPEDYELLGFMVVKNFTMTKLSHLVLVILAIFLKSLVLPYNGFEKTNSPLLIVFIYWMIFSLLAHLVHQHAIVTDGVLLFG